MKSLLCLIIIAFSFQLANAQRTGPQSSQAIKKVELHSRAVSFSPADSNTTVTGQTNYILKVHLPDTAQVHALRVNGRNNQGLSTVSNANHPLNNQTIYRNPKNKDYIVYINLGNRPTGSVKNGNVTLVGKNGNPLPGQSNSRAFNN